MQTTTIMIRAALALLLCLACASALVQGSPPAGPPAASAPAEAAPAPVVCAVAARMPDENRARL